jgi:hypothetical protein
MGVTGGYNKRRDLHYAESLLGMLTQRNLGACDPKKQWEIDEHFVSNVVTKWAKERYL